MDEKNILFLVVKAFSNVDLSPGRVDNVQMGYIFEELIRIGAEQSNEEAGEHFTPREVIKLMVNLLLSPEQNLRLVEVCRYYWHWHRHPLGRHRPLQTREPM